MAAAPAAADGRLRGLPPSAAGGAALAAAFFLLYFFTADRAYYYDSVLYAGIISQPLSSLPVPLVYSWNHFLWCPAARAFHVALGVLGWGGTAYQSLQLLNALIGAAGVGVLYSTLLRFSSPWRAAFWASLAGSSAAYWARSTGGEPYLAGAFFALLFGRALYSFLSAGGLRAYALACLFCGLSTWFHIGNNVLWAACAAALALRRREAPLLAPVLGAALLVFIFPYMAVHDLFSFQAVAAWWRWGSGLTNGILPVNNPLGQFDLALLRDPLLTAKTLLRSYFHFSGTWGGAAGLALALAGAATGLRAATIDRGALFAFGVPFALLLALFSVWAPGNTIYWAVITSLGCGLLAALAAGGARRGAYAAAIFLAALAANNFYSLILPNKRGLGAARTVDFCVKIKEAALPGSPVLINSTELKVYLPYFAGLPRISLDLVSVNAFAGGKDPLLGLVSEMSDYLRRGLPVYMTGDVLEAGDTYAGWGLGAAKISEALEPFAFVKVLPRGAEAPPGETLYLLRPKPGTIPVGAELQRNLEKAAAKLVLGAGGGTLAEESYKKRLAGSLTPEKAHNELGASLAEAGRLAEAEKEYREALKLAPGFAEARFNLGHCLALQGRGPEAEAEYSEAVRLDPRMARAHNNLGTLLYGRGDLAGAEASYRAALKAGPGYAEAHNNLGSALHRQGRPADAAAEYRKVIELEPRNARAHYNLGMALREMGNSQEGLHHLKTAVSLDSSLDPRNRGK